MGLLGKKKITTKEVFFDGIVDILDSTRDAFNWPEIIESLSDKSISAAEIESELVGLNCFLGDLAVHLHTEGKVSTELRDAVSMYLEKKNIVAFNNVMSRQTGYGEAYSNNPFPGKPNTYSVANKFAEFCSLDALDPANQLRITGMASGVISALTDLFENLSKKYQIVETFPD